MTTKWCAGLCLAFLLLPAVARARPAQCETSDDGRYACDFQPDGRDGSFTISAKGKPTFMIVMSEPGVADGFLSIDGGRNVALPGPYRSSRTEPGCWVSDGTRTKICAR